MGLDIDFQLDKAMSAGLTIHVALNDYREYGDEAQSLEHLGKLPGRDIAFSLGEFTRPDGTIFASVRANKWGQLYEPLTSFLRKHHIPWEEN